MIFMEILHQLENSKVHVLVVIGGGQDSFNYHVSMNTEVNSFNPRIVMMEPLIEPCSIACTVEQPSSKLKPRITTLELTGLTNRAEKITIRTAV
eukprot:UN03841